MKRLFTALLIISLLFSGSVWGASQTFQGDITGNAATVTNLTVTSATEVGQGWTTPVFDAGNFTASGSMTWTVDAGDVTTYAYVITGKMMTVAYRITTSSVGGTPDSELWLAIPASKTATKSMDNLCAVLDNGAWTAGRAYVSAGLTVIKIPRMDGVAYTASTNTTRVFGQITFEIN